MSVDEKALEAATSFIWKDEYGSLRETWKEEHRAMFEAYEAAKAKEQPDDCATLEARISFWSTRPQPGTPEGEAWVRGCEQQGYEWGQETVKAPKRESRQVDEPSFEQLVRVYHGIESNFRKFEKMLSDYMNRPKREIVGGWQPIETAPKDKYILVASSKGDVNKAAWNNGIWAGAGYAQRITHWMPLPDTTSIEDGASK